MIKETELGFEIESESHLCFFGKKTAHIEILKKAYPLFVFKEVKQTHSDILTYSTDKSLLENADAHWTDQKSIALYIKTADCIPLLVIDKQSKNILAVHAGWKGVENKIIEKSLLFLEWQNIFAFWGPHILQDSFEVQEDVYHQLMKSSYSKRIDLFKKNNNRYHINLLEIAKSQVSHICESSEVEILFDTKTDLRFHSHRRDKEIAGRNISFIVKK